MSRVWDIYSLVHFCVCKLRCTCMNLYIFQQGSPNCSVLFVCLFVRFYAIQKKTQGFCLGGCPAFALQTRGQRLKKQNILLTHSNANLMQIWCSCVPPFQPTLETPAPTWKPVSAVTPWNRQRWIVCITKHTRRIYCKMRCPRGSCLCSPSRPPPH